MRQGQFFGRGLLKVSVYKNPYNNCCQVSFSLSEYTKIDVGWGFHPRSHWESLQRSPRPRSWFQWGRFAAGREWREGRTRERGMRKGGEKGEVGK